MGGPREALAKLADEWADQSTDYDEDTEQQIADGRALRELLAAHPAEPAPVASPERVAEVLQAAASEWDEPIGDGDVAQLVAALLAAGVFRDEAQVKAEALEEAADELATAAQGWATPKLMKDIPEDWDAHHLTVRHASQIALENASRALRTAALRAGEPS